MYIQLLFTNVLEKLMLGVLGSNMWLVRWTNPLDLETERFIFWVCFYHLIIDKNVSHDKIQQKL